MGPAAVTPELLQRLSRIGGGRARVVSVYVSLDRSRFPTPGARETELQAVLADARKRGAAAGAEADADVRSDTERIRVAFEQDPWLLAGATGVAAFAARGGEELEVVELPVAVEPCAVVSWVPWLAPMARVLHRADWAVALVSRRDARVFRGGADGLVQVAAVEDDVHRRHAQGGWSQSRFQRGIDEEVAAHARRVAGELFARHQEAPVGHVLLGCSDELGPVVLDALHPELRERVADRIEIDVERSSAAEVLEAARPVIERFDARDREQLLTRLGEALGTNGHAAAGLADVLATLEQERVAVLFVADGRLFRDAGAPRAATWRRPASAARSTTSSWTTSTRPDTPSPSPRARVSAWSSWPTAPCSRTARSPRCCGTERRSHSSTPPRGDAAQRSGGSWKRRRNSSASSSTRRPSTYVLDSTGPRSPAADWTRSKSSSTARDRPSPNAAAAHSPVTGGRVSDAGGCGGGGGGGRADASPSGKPSASSCWIGGPNTETWSRSRAQ